MLRSRQVGQRRVHPMLSWRPRSRHGLTFTLLLVVALAGPALEAGEPHPSPQVDQFTPLGTVKRVRQASATFSEPMVPFGDPRSPVDPFVIDCPEDGTGRWIDSRTWVYDFARDLPGGVRCSFQTPTRPGNPGRDAGKRPDNFHLYNRRSIDLDVHAHAGFNHRRRSGVCPRPRYATDRGIGIATRRIRSSGSSRADWRAADHRRRP